MASPGRPVDLWVSVLIEPVMDAQSEQGEPEAADTGMWRMLRLYRQHTHERETSECLKSHFRTEYQQLNEQLLTLCIEM